MTRPNRVFRPPSEAKSLIDGLNASSMLFSDHVSNYVHLRGKLPDDKGRFKSIISKARQEREDKLYPFFFGRKIADKC